MAELYTASGSKLYIAPSVAAEPADAAAYAALTWVEVGFLSNIGEYGDEASLQTGAVIGDARVRKAKGSRDAGTLTITVYPDPDDLGQAALIQVREPELFLRRHPWSGPSDRQNKTNGNRIW